MKKFQRISAFVLAVILTVLSVPFPAMADQLPYDTYNYDYWDNVVFTPAAYVPDGAISGVGLQVGAFSGPQDICVAPNGDLYIADTGNNRIIVVDDRGEKVLKIIDTFDNQGAEDTFNAPTGVCVSENGQLYIADR